LRRLRTDRDLDVAQLLAQPAQLALAVLLALLGLRNALRRTQLADLALVARHGVAGRAQLAADALEDLHRPIRGARRLLNARLNLAEPALVVLVRGLELVVLGEQDLDALQALVELLAALLALGRAGAVGLRHLGSHAVLGLQAAPDLDGLAPGERDREDAAP